jgi:5,10-methylenetetrahydrofolate reductase
LKAPDKQKASIELFAETVKSLKDLCQGVHIITIGGQDKLADYLNEAKLR